MDQNISVDSLESSLAIAKETKEYAADLARELIEDTNILVRPADDIITPPEHTETLEIPAEPPLALEPEEPSQPEQPEQQEQEQEQQQPLEEEPPQPPTPTPPSSCQEPQQIVEVLSEDTPIDISVENADTSHLINFNKSLEEEDMEFSKNYSDDLMGQSEGIQQPSADLADFEMPPHSGSSSGSEPRQQTPLERKSSSPSAAQPTSRHQSATTTTSSPNLSAVKNLITSSYSRFSHVFQWERPLESGIIFGVGVTIIMTLTFFSIISVFAYSALAVILTSALLRLYKTVCKTLNRPSKTPFDHIWDKVLGLNVTLSPEKMHQLVDSSLSNLNASLVYFKQVLLFEDKYATLKFGTFLYALTYLGAWFNGMTLITIVYLSLFSVPILYQKNQTNIDQYLKLATGHISSALSMVTNRASSLVSNQSASLHQD